LTVRKLLRDPLVHFLAIGLLLFALYGLVAPADTGGDRIVITRAMVDDMAAQHRKLWNRDPTAAELKGLIESRVTDEILYREGLAMGLDRDDAVIKRRVSQKYDLIAEEADSIAPTDADLEAYLKANPDRFRSAPVVSFRQVMIPTDGSEADVRARVAKALAALGGGADPATVGNASLLPAQVSAQALDLVARDFGSDFAAALVSAPEGQWLGPVPSAYGLHLVRIDRRVPAAVPPLADVRREVQREWENARRETARAARLEKLRAAYRIEIEGAPAA
jgi:hypothetical protein